MNNKIFKRFICFVLVICTLCLFACKKKNQSESESALESVYESVPETSSEETLEKTGVNIVENGQTDYALVIPEDCDSMTGVAGQELIDFIYLSTGVDIPVVRDQGLTFNPSSKYISVGPTTLIDGAGIEISKDELGESGYVIKTVGNTLFISGYTANTYYGTMYGVYDFLERTIGFKAYAADEVVYDQMSEVPLYDFNIKYRPTVDIRYMSYKCIKADKTYANRMRSLANNDEIWSTFTHTLISNYLPFETYGAAHPEWYVNGGQQLCLTNEEMIEELIIRVQFYLSKYPKTTHVMLGHEDNWTYCRCERCTAKMNEYGGNLSGVELELSNTVAERVNAWLETEYPGRDVKYVFFAYGPSLPAPVSYDAETDTYTPMKEDIYIHEDVGVMLAPVSMNFGEKPDSLGNQSSYVSMNSWSWLFKKQNVYLWSYALNAYSYFFNANTFGYIKDYCEYFKELGVKYVYNQGYYDSYVCTFEAMRVYTESMLYWDCTLDYNELVDDFMKNYYGLASTNVKKYYNAIRTHYAYLDTHDYTTGKVFFMLDDKKLWPIGLVNTLLGYLDQALVDLEPLKDTDPDRYEVLYSRVQRERLSPLYMMLSYYINQLSDEVKLQYVNEFEKYAKMFYLEATREASYGVISLIEQWKNS